MAINILQPPTKQATPQPPVTSLQEAVETIQIDALQHLRELMESHGISGDVVLD